MLTLLSNYKILKEQNLIIEYHKGTQNVNSYINFKKKMVLDSSFSFDYNLLVHFKNVAFKAATEDINKLVDFLANNTPEHKKKRVAIITHTPHQVAFTTLYKSKQKNVNQTVEIFSTEENALKWLDIPNLSTIEVINILADLKGK